MPRASAERPGNGVHGRLSAKVALITGGESGIGLAAARLFVAEGARVFLAGLDQQALERARDQLDGGTEVAVVDVTDETAVRNCVESVVGHFGTLDVVFSNAGISGPIGPLTDFSLEEFRRVIDVHVIGAFNVLKHALRVMSAGGSVIINSSVVGLTADPFIGAYATAKHAQVGLMRVAAKEAAVRQIRVNTIHPGPTSTSFQTDVETRATGRTPDDAARVFDAMIPLGRHADPREIAQLVLFLASDESCFITGATMAIDGGMSI